MPTDLCTQQFGVEDPRAGHERVYEVAFNSERKYMEVRAVLFFGLFGVVVGPVHPCFVVVGLVSFRLRFYTPQHKPNQTKPTNNI